MTEDLTGAQPQGAAAELPERRAWAEQVCSALLALDAQTRAVLLLGYRDRLTQPEVARRLSVPEPTVRALAARGLARMAEAVTEPNPAPA